LEKLSSAFKVVAAAIKKDRRDTEEAHRRREEERKQAEEERRRAEEHKRKAEFVTELMQNWEEADRLRKFAKALEESATQLELSDDEKRDVRQVVEWSTPNSLIHFLIFRIPSPSLPIQNGRIHGSANDDAKQSQFTRTGDTIPGRNALSAVRIRVN
jgi:hypothetical protein